MLIITFQDKTAILYAAVLLENEDLELLNLSLDILENFAENEETHSFLLSTFGIYESIESLSIRYVLLLGNQQGLAELLIVYQYLQSS